MIPSPRLLALAALLFAAALVAAVLPHLGPLSTWAGAWERVWGAAAALGAGLATLDALLALPRQRLHARRRVPSALAVGVWHGVHLRLSNPGVRPVVLDVFDHYPTQAAMQGLPQRISVPARGWAELRYRLRPTRRGHARFAPVQVRRRSPLGLWLRSQNVGRGEQVPVYPDFSAVARYVLLAAEQRLGQMGIRKRRRRGEGTDFHQLREFRPGDRLAQVDWKATARMRRPISREFQDERNQEVVFLLDCGRRMLSRDGDLSHFDHALNAMLLLAYVALRQGDAVGLATFGGERRSLRPVRGAGGVRRLLNAVFDLEPSTQTPDYARAAADLLAQQRKRALVLVLSNLRDEDADDLIPALTTLRRRHLVVLASLREQALDAAAEAPVEGFEEALMHAAVRDFLQQRETAIAQVAARGIACLDVTPPQLPVALVNRYLELKGAGSL